MNDSFIIAAGVVLLLLVSIVMIRVIIGPTIMDRIVAINVVGTKTTVLIIVIGMVFDRVGMFVDIALAYALLNFIMSIAAAKFFQQHKQLEIDS